MKNIANIMKDTGISDYETFGKYMAKIDLNEITPSKRKNGKLILMTAITPTPAGEGKTTTAIGLAQAFRRLNLNSGIAIREPSLGPVFGVKGGATGGGKSTVEPSDKINLIFTGDFPAISAAHNLLSAMVNNHISHGNDLNIDPKNVVFPRAIDMDDRSLRSIIVGNGNKNNGTMMMDSFVITAASEIMAIMALSRNYEDLKERLGNILVGYTYHGKPVFARDINAQGAMSALLVDALKPNMVQSVEGTPAIIHTGPFGNIAHGTSSILGDILGLQLFDYLVTEAGFGSDLGFEKFMNIFTRISNILPDSVVIVATLRGLKYHGGSIDIDHENIDSIREGFKNLLRHVNIVRGFGIIPVVTINKHKNDTDSEIRLISELLEGNNIDYALSDVYSGGSEGGIELARKVIENIDKNGNKKIKYTYDIDSDPEKKITDIAKKIYGAANVIFSNDAKKDLVKIKKHGFSKFYVCMAKTQGSISDDPSKLNNPENFDVHINKINVNSGSQFIIPILGNIMTMPGLPKKPAAENVDIDSSGNIVGLN